MFEPHILAGLLQSTARFAEEQVPYSAWRNKLSPCYPPICLYRFLQNHECTAFSAADQGSTSQLNTYRTRLRLTQQDVDTNHRRPIPRYFPWPASLSQVSDRPARNGSWSIRPVRTTFDRFVEWHPRAVGKGLCFVKEAAKVSKWLQYRACPG